MSLHDGTKIPAQRTSAESTERRKPTRAEIRQRFYVADLRDALAEARTLMHFERAAV